MIGYYNRTHQQHFDSRQAIIDYMLLLLEHNTFAVDVETISLDDRTPVGMAVAVSPNEAFYFTLHPEQEELTPWTNLRYSTLIFHNSLFDLEVLDVELNAESTALHDTLAMANLLCLPGKLSELSLVLDTGHEVHDMKEYLKKGMTTLDLSTGQLGTKCCQDACATFAAYELLYPQVNKELYEVEIALVPILLEMSERGIRLDQQRRAELEGKYTTDIAFYLQLCQDQELPNPNSPAQVGFILAKRGNLLPMYRKKNKRGKWEQKIKTSKEYLRDLPDPLAQAILAYKHAAKMKSTYLVPLAGLERAYTHWHMDASTGRISSTDRNLQNVAYDIRQMFVPDSEVFTAWDASQIEIRVMAYMSQDSEMLRIFETGGDIHQEVADFLQIDRKIAKNTFFSISYGAGDQRAAFTAKIHSLQRARELKEGLFRKFPDWARWIERQKLQAMVEGYVYTLYGRKLATAMEGDDPSSIARKGVDFPAQGSAAEIIKRAMIKCKELPMVLQVHDELIADGNVVEEVKALELENIAPFRVPFNIKTMERWEE